MERSREVRSGVIAMAQAAARIIAANATVYDLKRTSDQIQQARVDGKAIPDMSIGANVFD